jgi:hypothetical protein
MPPPATAGYMLVEFETVARRKWRYECAKVFLDSFE